MIPSFADWGSLLDNGGQEQLGMLIDETLKEWQAEQASREALELFQYGILNMLYRVAYRKGLSIYEVFTAAELKDYQVPRNSRQPGRMGFEDGWQDGTSIGGTST